MAVARTRGRGGEVTAKPRFDAYAGMLVLSLLAMLTGSVLLYLDYSQYDGSKPTLPPAVKVGAAAAAPPSGGPAVPPGPGVPPPGPPQKPPGAP